MHIEDLSRMANQIAHFFAPYPEDEAVAGVQDHLMKFWDPIMRRELLAASPALVATLHPLVQQALGRMRAGTAS